MQKCAQRQESELSSGAGAGTGPTDPGAKPVPAVAGVQLWLPMMGGHRPASLSRVCVSVRRLAWTEAGGGEATSEQGCRWGGVSIRHWTQPTLDPALPSLQSPVAQAKVDGSR